MSKNEKVWNVMKGMEPVNKQVQPYFPAAISCTRKLISGTYQAISKFIQHMLNETSSVSREMNYDNNNSV